MDEATIPEATPVHEWTEYVGTGCSRGFVCAWCNESIALPKSAKLAIGDCPSCGKSIAFGVNDLNGERVFSTWKREEEKKHAHKKHAKKG